MLPYILLAVSLLVAVFNFLPIVGLPLYGRTVTPKQDSDQHAHMAYGLWRTCVYPNDKMVDVIDGYGYKKGCVGHNQKTCKINTAAKKHDISCLLLATNGKVKIEGDIITVPVTKNKGHNWSIMTFLLMTTAFLTLTSFILDCVEVAGKAPMTGVGGFRTSHWLLLVAAISVVGTIVFDMTSIKKATDPSNSLFPLIADFLRARGIPESTIAQMPHIQRSDVFGTKTKREIQMYLWIASVVLIAVILVAPAVFPSIKS
jgi:hypothetical protein